MCELWCIVFVIIISCGGGIILTELNGHIACVGSFQTQHVTVIVILEDSSSVVVVCRCIDNGWIPIGIDTIIDSSSILYNLNLMIIMVVIGRRGGGGGKGELTLLW